MLLIRTDDHAVVNDLCAHYRRSGFRVESVGGGMIEVARPDAPDEAHERREVEMHLLSGRSAIWAHTLNCSDDEWRYSRPAADD
jgi:hypothetical protein